MKTAAIKVSRSYWTRRFLTFLFTFFIMFQLVVPTYAYTLVYIQCSIDLATWEILAVPVRDEIGVSSASNEIRRVEGNVLSSLKSNAKNPSANLTLISGLADDVQNRSKSLANGGNFVAGLVQNIGWLEENNRVLSYPTDQVRRDSSTSTDFNNAMNTVNEISFDLNQAFAIYCEENAVTKTDDASAFLSSMSSFLTSVSGSMSSDGTLTYGGFEFKWCVEKEPGGNEYVNWFMLVYEAFNNYALDGDEAVTSDNVYSATPNQLTKTLVGFFGNMLDGLRGILGMWSMDELIFNTGWREKGYVGGIFPTSWEPYVWTLFIFMEIFAAMILLYGILNNVVKKAMSTINTIQRMRFMEQVKDLLVCAIALALLPVVLRIVITLSSSFTSLIYELVPINSSTNKKRTIAESVARYGAGGGSIGGIIAQFMFFGIQVSFNFLYAMRAAVTAILIIIAPVMIAMISVGGARKQSTVLWVKELLAQICIQPIHAFCIAVILLLPTSSHGFDNIIVLYALLPFSAVIKGFFFGPSGSWADQAAQRATKRTTGTLAAGALGAAGAAVGGAAMAIGGSMGVSSGNSNNANTGGASEDSGSTNDGLSTLSDTASSKKPQNGETIEAGQSTQDKPTIGENLSDKAAEQKAKSYDLYDKYFDSQSPIADARYRAASLGAAITAGAAHFANSPTGQAVDKAAGVAGKAIGSAAQKVGQLAKNSAPGQTLHRVGNAINNSNTAQALRENNASAPSLDSTRMSRAANTINGMGKDAVDLGKRGIDTAKTGLKIGTGLAFGAIGGAMGGMGGRQLMNLGSGMLSSIMQPTDNSQMQDDDGPEPNLNLGDRANGQTGEQATPTAPDAISDVDQFAAEYAEMEAQGGGENYSIDRGLGTWIPNNSEGTIEYDFGKDDMPAMGITSMRYDKESQSIAAQFDFSKMSARDRANAQQMVSLWQGGTDAERDFMRQSGIKNVFPVIKKENGESKVVGMRMSIDKKAYAKNFGVQFDPSGQASENGRNVAISAPAQSAPQIIPNLSQHMEAAVQKDPQSALGNHYSPIRAAMVSHNSQPSPTTQPQNGVDTSSSSSTNMQQPEPAADGPIVKSAGTLTDDSSQGTPHSGPTIDLVAAFGAEEIDMSSLPDDFDEKQLTES